MALTGACLQSPLDEPEQASPALGASTGAGAGGLPMNEAAPNQGLDPTSEQNRIDFAALARCASVEPCPVASAVGGPDSPARFAGFECVLEGLRDRRPGVYAIETRTPDSTFAHLLALTVSGLVETSTRQIVRNAQGQTRDGFTPARRCEPRAPDYYDDCLLSLSRGGELGASPSCAWLTGSAESWLAGCRSQPPSCE